MKVIIPGGTGQLGGVLARALRARGDEVVVLGRRAREGVVPWDGCTLGAWARQVDGADVVVNLAGRTVNCRYTEQNLAEMMSSRVESTNVVGLAIAQAARPPHVWLQMSTATIYAHRHGALVEEPARVPTTPARRRLRLRLRLRGVDRCGPRARDAPENL
jgi:uncharacterized protein